MEGHRITESRSGVRGLESWRGGRRNDKRCERERGVSRDVLTLYAVKG